MKRTYQPKKRKRARTHGFRARMRRAPAGSRSSGAATRAASASRSDALATPGSVAPQGGEGCRAAQISTASFAAAARTPAASSCSTCFPRARTRAAAARAVGVAQGRGRRGAKPRQAPVARGVCRGGRPSSRRDRRGDRGPTAMPMRWLKVRDCRIRRALGELLARALSRSGLGRASPPGRGGDSGREARRT